jgi:hypothetical protein
MLIKITFRDVNRATEWTAEFTNFDSVEAALVYARKACKMDARQGRVVRVVNIALPL